MEEQFSLHLEHATRKVGQTALYSTLPLLDSILNMMDKLNTGLIYCTQPDGSEGSIHEITMAHATMYPIDLCHLTYY